MRSLIVAALLAGTLPIAASAQTAQVAVATPADKAAAAAMTTGTTAIGDMLDNAAAKAVLQKHLPTIVSSDQIDMARGMTLKDIKTYAADEVTDTKLAAIDHDLAALKK